MTFSKGILSILISLSFATLTSCEYSIDRLSSYGVFPLLVEELEILTAETSEVVDGEYRLKYVTPERMSKYGCILEDQKGDRTGVDAVAVEPVLDSEGIRYGIPLKDNGVFTFDSVRVAVLPSGSTAGIRAEVYRANTEGLPVGEALSTSPTVILSTITEEYTEFKFSKKITQKKDEDLIILMILVVGEGTIDGPNATGVYSGALASDCTAYTTGVLSSSNGGVTWSSQARVPYYYFESKSFLSHGHARWIINGGVGSQWDLSSLSIPEVLREAGSAEVLYSIGVSDDGVIEDYILKEKTLPEVQASGVLSGDHLHIRVELQSKEDGFFGSAIASGYIRKL